MKRTQTMFKTIAKGAFFAMCALPVMTSFQSKAQIINTIAGTGSAGYSGDGGAATAAELNYASGTCYDASGNLYIADAVRSLVRKVTPSGTISTIAGTGTPGYNGDGIDATAAQLYNPRAVTIDASGNIYIVDQLNQSIRMVNTSGVISTYAGGRQGFWGDGGAATDAALSYPTDAVFDDVTGNLYIADIWNNRVRVVYPSGTINTYAGGGYSFTGCGDGNVCSNSGLGNCANLFLRGRTLYVTENYASRVRKIDLTTDIISTVVGDGSLGVSTAAFSGDGGPATAARIDHPAGITGDASGNLYVADNGNARIRKVSASGIISTYAGTGTAGFNGDGLNATATQIYAPGVGMDPAGNLVLSDGSNNRVRIVSTKMPSFVGGRNQSLSVCNNWVNANVASLLRVADAASGNTLTWSVISAPAHGTATVSYSTTSTGSTMTPVGTYYTPTSGYSGSDVFTVQISDGTFTNFVNINVTVNALPATPTISGTTSICLASSTTLTPSVSGGSWNGSSSVFSYTSGGVVTGTHAGTGVINYRVYNAAGCWSQGSTSINVVAPGAIAGFSGGTAASSVCPGGSFTLTHATAGGTWSSTNNSIATVSGGTIVGVAPGIDTVYYTVTNACGTAAARWRFRVTGAPSVAGVSGYATPFCPGRTATLTDATAGGTWTSSNPSVVPVSSSGVIAAATAGTAVISYTVTNSCGFSATATRTVTVSPNPNAGTITGPTSVVNGSTITLSTTGSGGTWLSAATSIATINSAGLVRGRAVGFDSIFYRVSNYCGTAYAGYVINVTASRGAQENGGAIAGTNEAGIKLYPNPTNGIINLAITGTGEEAAIMITDISGKVVVTKTTTEKALEIDMSGVPTGVYLVRVSTDGQVFTDRIIVE